MTNTHAPLPYWWLHNDADPDFVTDADDVDRYLLGLESLVRTTLRQDCLPTRALAAVRPQAS